MELGAKKLMRLSGSIRDVCTERWQTDPRADITKLEQVFQMVPVAIAVNLCTLWYEVFGPLKEQ